MKYGNISEKDRKGQKKKNIGTKMKFFPPFILQYLQVGIYIGKYINRPFVEFKKKRLPVFNIFQRNSVSDATT